MPLVSYIKYTRWKCIRISLGLNHAELTKIIKGFDGIHCCQIQQSACRPQLANPGLRSLAGHIGAAVFRNFVCERLSSLQKMPSPFCMQGLPAGSAHSMLLYSICIGIDEIFPVLLQLSIFSMQSEHPSSELFFAATISKSCIDLAGGK